MFILCGYIYYAYGFFVTIQGSPFTLINYLSLTFSLQLPEQLQQSWSSTMGKASGTSFLVEIVTQFFYLICPSLYCHTSMSLVISYLSISMDRSSRKNRRFQNPSHFHIMERYARTNYIFYVLQCDRSSATMYFHIQIVALVRQ